FAAESDARDQGALVATQDLSRARRHRAGMGFFRDRRPDLYGRIAQDI
ncbi:MAG: N-carbamoylputrescine amidase, partial [Sphingobium sp.]